MSKTPLVAGCSCIYCLWRRALGEALAAKMDREIMEAVEESGPQSGRGPNLPKDA